MFVSILTKGPMLKTHVGGLSFLPFPLLAALACSSPGTEPGSGTGGAKSSGGSGPSTGGATGSGGTNSGTGGTTASGSGGGTSSSSGGTTAGSGGSASGGMGNGGAGAGSGGSSGSTGGNSATGGRTGGNGAAGAGGSSSMERADVLSALTSANDWFMKKWPDPGKDIDSTHPSHIWTRGVYYEGLMALYGVDPQKRYYDYAVSWGNSHSWGLRDGTTTTSADNQCAGQTYIDLYNIDKQAVRIRDIQTNIDRVVASSSNNPWSWIDAIQMAMPIFAKLGVLTGNNGYFNKMYSLYAYTKNSFGTNGLYNKTEHLWWRDADFDPPYAEPNGKNCYWSRGNGWVYAALARVLEILPESDSHRAEYMADFVAMSDALRAVQRSDGFWNVSLFDPTNFGGKETTGTALFAYGMAMGARKGWLPDATYRPVALKAWNAMVKDALHADGFLGYVQGTGKQPSDSQPVTYDKLPNYDDFGVGCFLLGGSEVYKLLAP